MVCSRPGFLAVPGYENDATTEEGERVAYDGTSSFALSPENEDTLAQALKFAEAGIPVLPTHGLREDGRCTCGNDGEEHRKNRGKHPAVGHGHNDATLDGARLIQWFDADRGWNVAVPGGEVSGLLFLDADVAGGGLQTLDDWFELGLPDLPQTLRCRTGGGGLHIVYALPPGAPRLKSGRVLPGIDLKCDGGYVVTAPSRHHSGGRYRWIEPDVVVATAPDDLVVWLLTTPRIKAGGGTAGGGEIAGYDYAVLLRDGCPPGMRDEFFNELAFRARKVHRLDESQALELVRREWERVEQGDHPFSWDEARAKVRNVYAKAHLAPDIKSDPRLTALAASWAATVNGQAPATESAVPQAVFSDGGGEVAESTAGVGSSGQAGGGGGTGGGQGPVRGPAFTGPPPEFERDLTHTGNAHRFVKMFGSQVMHVAGVGWYTWDGNRWRLDETGRTLWLTQAVLQRIRMEQEEHAADQGVANALGRHYDASSSDRGRRAMLGLAAVEPEVAVVLDDLNRDAWQLVVQNGTLELKTQTLRESRPEDRNTRCAAVAYDPSAKCPQWEAHVDRVTRRADGSADPELARYLRRWAGYSLTGSVGAEKFFFGFGEGANGKNVLIEALLGMLGDYGHTAGAKLFSEKEHDTVIMDLAGRRMVFIDETVKGKVNDGRLKMLTGSSRITARKIAKDSVTFNATFKLWLAGNHKPRVDDTSEGFWRRLELVPFDAVIPRDERRADYGTVLKAEWPGILNWALAGLADYLEQEERLVPPARVAAAVTEYREQEDIFGQFVKDTFVVDATGDVTSGASTWYPSKFLRKLYDRWCADEGVARPLTPTYFTQELRRQHFVAEGPHKVVWAYSATAKSERGWRGPVLQDGLVMPQDMTWHRQGEVTAGYTS